MFPVVHFASNVDLSLNLQSLFMCHFVFILVSLVFHFGYFVFLFKIYLICGIKTCEPLTLWAQKPV